MSYSFARGLAAAVDGYQRGMDSQTQRDRQMKQDAVAEERLNRERVQWVETDRQNADIDAVRAETLKQIQKPLADPHSPQGYKAEMDLNVPQTERQKRQGDTPFQYGEADVYTPAGVSEVAQAQQANNVSALQMAGRNPQMIAAIRQADMNSRLSMESAGLANYIQNDASPADLQRLMSDIKFDKSNTYEPVFDPQTGMTRIKKGDTEVELNRADLGKLVAAQNRLKKGDASAQDVVDSIYAKQEKRVSDSLHTAQVLSQSENSAATQLANIKARNAAVAVQAQRAAAQPRTAAARTKLGQGVGGFAEAAAMMEKLKPTNEGTGNAVAFNNLANIYDINPNVPKTQAILAAQDMAFNGPAAKVVPRLDFNKGSVVLNHINEDGVQTPVRYAQNGFKPTDEHIAGFQEDVQSYLASEDARVPGLGRLISSAANGEKSAMEALPAFVAGNAREKLYALVKDKAVTPQQKAQAMAEIDARVASLLPREMQRVNNALSLVKIYGKKQ